MNREQTDRWQQPLRQVELNLCWALLMVVAVLVLAGFHSRHGVVGYGEGAYQDEAGYPSVTLLAVSQRPMMVVYKDVDT